jgi:hypothetical protein
VAASPWVIEAPADATYRVVAVVSHSSKNPEESLAGGTLRIRIEQE